MNNPVKLVAVEVEDNLVRARDLLYERLQKLGVKSSLIKKLLLLEKAPRVLFGELGFQTGLKEDPERAVTAMHEAGHALVAFLIDEKSILSINLSKIHTNTRAALNDFFDLHVENGNVAVEELVDNDDCANLYLAGLAATTSQHQGSQFHSSEVAIGNKFDYKVGWSDIDEPYRIIFEGLGGEKTDDEVQSIFFQWLAKLTEIFKTEKFQRALKIITHIALQPATNIPAHEHIKKSLLENGFTDSELAEMTAQVKTCSLKSFVPSSL